jgi:hypothetical protein
MCARGKVSERRVVAPEASPQETSPPAHFPTAASTPAAVGGEISQPDPSLPETPSLREGQTEGTERTVVDPLDPKKVALKRTQDDDEPAEIEKEIRFWIGRVAVRIEI